MSQATEKYHGKILALRESEFPGQDGVMIKGFNLDIKTTPETGISVWINDDGVIDTKKLKVGSTINVTVEERLRQDGRLKRKLISIDADEVTEEPKTEQPPF